MGNVLPHPEPVAEFLEIKVKPNADQKKLIETAANAVKPFPLSMGKWMLLAALEKLERDGFTDPKKVKR